MARLAERGGCLGAHRVAGETQNGPRPMIAVILLIVILVLSLTITRIGAVALTLTGISAESARFQARSAFSGVGFTTTEAEAVVNHPVRRRIVMLLMLLGNVGVATVIATLMISLLKTSQSGNWLRNLLLLAGGLIGVWIAGRSRWLDQLLSRWVAKGLRRWSALDVRDYVGLLRLAGEYAVLELQVQEGDWLAGKSLAALKLPDEGVLVLGVQRPDSTYIGAPIGTTIVCPGDVLIVYGPISRVTELDERRAGRAGVKAHQAAVTEQDERIEEQQATDPVVEEASDAQQEL